MVFFGSYICSILYLDILYLVFFVFIVKLNFDCLLIIFKIKNIIKYKKEIFGILEIDFLILYLDSMCFLFRIMKNYGDC